MTGVEFFTFAGGAPIAAADLIDDDTQPGGATEGPDNLVGTSGDDTIDGLGGDDTISGGQGSDVIEGGAGSDTAVYTGARGDLTITSPTAGTFVVASGAGTDTLTGVEFFTFAGGAPVAAADLIDDDTPPGGGTPTQGPDNLVGTEGPDTISGLDGNDTITALGGDDRINGGAGNDSIDAGAGVDTVRLNGAFGTYTFDNLGQGGVVASGPTGNDTMLAAEVVEFTDRAVNLADGDPLFDPLFYLTTYADVAAAGADPLAHYMAFGAAEGRDPSTEFDTKAYLAAYADVAAAGVNPLQHFLQFGIYEGRQAFGDGNWT